MKITVASKHLPAIFMLRQGDAPAGVTVNIPPVVERRGVGFETVATAILTFGSGVAAGVVANWLYEKLRDKPTTRITINRTEIHLITRDEIVRVLEEEIAKEEHP